MEVEIPLDGGGLWVLQNHFKSKFGGRVKSEGNLTGLGLALLHPGRAL